MANEIIDLVGGTVLSKAEMANRLRGRSPEQQAVIRYFLAPGGCMSRGVSDQEYDAIVRRRLKNVGSKQQALDLLGLDEDQVKEILPVRFSGFEYRGKVYARSGLDDVLRSSSYSITWLFFSSEQVYTCQFVINFDEDGKSTRSEEYFYRDITTFSTFTETVEVSRANSGGGCTGSSAPVRTTRETDYFKLVVPGDSFLCAMTKSDSLKKSIRAMQQKLREKKTAM